MIIKFKTVSLACMLTLSIITTLLGIIPLLWISNLTDGIPNLPQDTIIPVPVIIITFSGLMIGPLCYALTVQTIRRFFLQEASMEFDSECLKVRSGSRYYVIKYTEMKRCIVYNNTDYARIIVETDRGKYTWHAGLSNLNLWAWRNTNRYRIIDSFAEIDACLVGFEKIISLKKGMEIVRYEKIV
jgi:hypothetical protein